MELIRGLHNLRPRHRGCVATIGNFDGVHLGHQAVIARLRASARERALPATVICFEPQPQEFFAGEAAPARLTRLRDKLRAFARTEVERVVLLRFDESLARLPAEEFIDRVLHRGLGVVLLVVGDDFRFGRGGKGDFRMLEAAGRRLGFEVQGCATFASPGGRVSSSRVRDALARDDLAETHALLGRTYTLGGRVAHGRELGRTIGFPTANLALARQRVALAGVYAVRVRGLADTALPGVANVGRRPTVDGTRLVLEVHLLDFSAPLYGKHLEVEFHHKIRAEERFESIEALRAQIARDVERARDLLGRRT